MKAIRTLDNQPLIDDIKLPEMSLNVTVGLRPPAGPPRAQRTRGSAPGGHLRHVSQLVLVLNIISDISDIIAIFDLFVAPPDHLSISGRAGGPAGGLRRRGR